MEQITGEVLRDEGMARALAHANSVNENWGVRAYEFLLSYVRGLQGDDTFLSEDVRVASRDTIEEPPDPRTWGPVYAKAVKNGIIQCEGYVNSRNPVAHCKPVRIWKKVSTNN